MSPGRNTLNNRIILAALLWAGLLAGCPGRDVPSVLNSDANSDQPGSDDRVTVQETGVDAVINDRSPMDTPPTDMPVPTDVMPRADTEEPPDVSPGMDVRTPPVDTGAPDVPVGMDAPVGTDVRPVDTGPSPDVALADVGCATGTIRCGTACVSASDRKSVV